MFKPFRPPLLRAISNRVNTHDDANSREDSPPPNKKRRVSPEVIPDSPPTRKVHSGVVSTPSSTALRKPLLLSKVGAPATTSPSTSHHETPMYYMVLWRKFTTKKHKTWDDDGILTVSGGYARLQGKDGRELGRCQYRDPLLPGSTLSISGKDVEVDCILSREDYMAGKPFLGVKPRDPSSSSSVEVPSMHNAPHRIKPGLSVNAKRKLSNSGTESKPNLYSEKQGAAVLSKFKTPLQLTTVLPPDASGAPKARHDPDAPGAVVMKRLADVPKGKKLVDVVVDPFLGQHLREHQKEGIKFMYECVMGMRSHYGQGAILADEMGLGKTLQTIALIYTLLHQNPIHGSPPVIKKALIVCPASLIRNWKKEFNKWLGGFRCGVYVVEGRKGMKLKDFTHGKSYQIMIIGYEMLRTVYEDLKKGAGVDIVVADEGHRLKSEKNKASEAIVSLDTERRIILSGTPLQNSLTDLYTMVKFVNPGVLGAANAFKRTFELPILMSREPQASREAVELGAAREKELSDLTSQFILRRTADVLSNILPPKTEYILFCKPTQAQVAIYANVLASPIYGALSGTPENVLPLVTLLKKVCNAPALLLAKEDKPATEGNMSHLLDAIPQYLITKSSVEASSKFRILDRMMRHLSTMTEEKIVIASQYTATLDLVQSHILSLNLTYSRIDGKTKISDRQILVDAFNRTTAKQKFAFLLSTRAGGVGLNLIGASRLVLLDPDWNPAWDLQAMARLHRDGQKRPVKIYRLLISGGIDEKIFQRQIAKIGLADSVVDGKKNEGSFTPSELRDLFRPNLEVACQTHDLLDCSCEGSGVFPDVSGISTEIDSTSHVVLDDDFSDEELPKIPQLVKATKANVDAINEQIAKASKRKAKGGGGSERQMQALMQYAHVDTGVFATAQPSKEEFIDIDQEDGDGNGVERDSRRPVELDAQGRRECQERVTEILDDDLLSTVLGTHKCKISYVFVKR